MHTPHLYFSCSLLDLWNSLLFFSFAIVSLYFVPRRHHGVLIFFLIFLLIRLSTKKHTLQIAWATVWVLASCIDQISIPPARFLWLFICSADFSSTTLAYLAVIAQKQIIKCHLSSSSQNHLEINDRLNHSEYHNEME